MTKYIQIFFPLAWIHDNLRLKIVLQVFHHYQFLTKCFKSYKKKKINHLKSKLMFSTKNPQSCVIYNQNPHSVIAKQFSFYDEAFFILKKGRGFKKKRA